MTSKSAEDSYNEILKISHDLEKCLQFIDQESNGWKIRLENQQEINQQYILQQKAIQKHIEETNRNFYSHNLSID